MVAGQIVGARIREARQAAGLSQRELAVKIGTRRRNIIRWEHQENQPRVETIVAIARATGHDIDFFLSESTEADEDEEAAPMTLDDYLRLKVRQIMREGEASR